MDQSNSQFIGELGLSDKFSPKIASTPLGIVTPCNTVHPKQHLDLFSRFCMGTKCYAKGEENPKTAPSPWDFVNLPEENRATAIGNMHKKFGKNRTNDSGYIPLETDTHTHRRTHHNTSPMGVVAKYCDEYVCVFYYFTHGSGCEVIKQMKIAHFGLW